MERHLNGFIAVVLLSILITGCSINNGTSDKLSVSKGENKLPANSDSDQNISASESTQGLILKDNFLKSKDGHDFQVISWKFAKAYFTGDINTIKKYLLDPESKEHYYSKDNKFGNVEFLILKLSPKDIKEDSIIAEYEFQLKGEDTYSYLFLDMKRVNNEWKVQHFGIEK